MEQKRRRISIRKVMQTLVTFVVTGLCLFAILSADRVEQHKKPTALFIHVSDQDRAHFIDQKQVKRMLFDDRHIDLRNTELRAVDLKAMENILKSNPWIRDAQVFADNKRGLHVNVYQRVPVLRIFEADGDSYYIDTTMQGLPLSDYASPYLPIVTNVPPLDIDSVNKNTRAKILYLESVIQKSKFWAAQISSVSMNDEEEFELIPVVGSQKILIGDTSRLEEKFNNLFAFYQQIQNKIGWDKYTTIDVRFKGEVVASPSLKWHMPVDQANIDWVKMILANNQAEAGSPDNMDSNYVPAMTPVAPPAAVPDPAATAVAPPASVSHPAAPPAQVSALPLPSVFSGHVASQAPALKPKPQAPKPAPPKPVAVQPKPQAPVKPAAAGNQPKPVVAAPAPKPNAPKPAPKPLPAVPKPVTPKPGPPKPKVTAPQPKPKPQVTQPKPQATQPKPQTPPAPKPEPPKPRMGPEL